MAETKTRFLQLPCKCPEPKPPFLLGEEAPGELERALQQVSLQEHTLVCQMLMSFRYLLGFSKSCS